MSPHEPSWMPEAEGYATLSGHDHFVVPGCHAVPDHHGVVYIAQCGARCSPFGSTAEGTDRHEHCPECERHAQWW